MKSAAALALALQLLLAIGAGEGTGTAAGTSTGTGAGLQFQEQVVAGGPGDFMQVKHLVLRGSNFEIGKKLAEIARDQHGVMLTQPPDAERLKVQVLKSYMARNFPVHYQRMQGVAALYGADPEKGGVDFSGLFYNLGNGGCSVVFYPPRFTAQGEGILSRNYDFSTGTLDGREPSAGEQAATSRPYVLELYPDQGYASLAICAYDLVGGALDGINSEGLCVALLADDESASSRPVEPAMGTEVGLYELNIPRFLLDNCANCQEAKEMLLSAKHYYTFTPCHYIVADRDGNSFVWEYSYSNNKEYVIDGGGVPQVVTNHPIHPPSEAERAIAAKEAGSNSRERYERLTRRIDTQDGKCSLEFIKSANASVSPDDFAPPPQGRARGRTLWHALYYPEERRAQVDFYLGDKPDPEHPGRTRIARSGYSEFRLDNTP